MVSINDFRICVFILRKTFNTWANYRYSTAWHIVIYASILISSLFKEISFLCISLLSYASDTVTQNTAKPNFNTVFNDSLSNSAGISMHFPHGKINWDCYLNSFTVEERKQDISRSLIPRFSLANTVLKEYTCVLDILE
jgi:hypothetical protein